MSEHDQITPLWEEELQKYLTDTLKSVQTK